MALLDRFRTQPQWKHPDAAVRAEAVRHLSDPALLAELARTDADAHVRRAAIRRVSDPAVLAAVLGADADAAVRDEAQEALAQIALGSEADSARQALDALQDPRHVGAVARNASLEAIRRAAVLRIENPRTLAGVIRTADVPALRKEALARIDDPAVLAEIAVKSEHKDAALLAVERVSDANALETIASRSRHKAVSRRARAILDAQAPATVPSATREQRVRVCEAVEALRGREDWPEVAYRLAAAEESWRDLGPDAEMDGRFQAAASALHADLDRHHAEREAKERANERAKAEEGRGSAERTALVEEADALQGEDIPSGIEALESAWQKLEPQTGPAAETQERRFREALEAARRRHAALQDVETRRVRLLAVCGEIEALMAVSDLGEARRQWKALQKSWSGPGSMDGVDEALRERHARAVAAFEERQAGARADQQKKAAENAAARDQLVARVEALAKEEKPALREAERALRESKEALEDLGPLPAAHPREALLARLRTARQDLFGRVQELREADDWKRWVNVGIQEELAAKMEALLEVADLPEAARRMRELEEKWREAAETTRGQGDAVWQRFRTARDTVRTKCDAFFAQQKEERAACLEKKLALCVEAESLSSSTDWVKTAERLQHMQAEWQKIGPVPRTQARAVWERFRGACNTFFERRKQDLHDRQAEWTKNLAAKEALCVRAEALAASDDLKAGMAEAKKLQAEWKAIGPVKRSRSEAIWKRFRAACDIVFEGARAPKSAPAPAETPADTEAPSTAEAAEAAPAAVVDAPAVRARMTELCARVEAVAAPLRPSTPDMTDTAALVARLREALATNTIAGRPDEQARWRTALTEVDSARAAWKKLPPLPGDAEAHALTDRFERACREIQQSKPR